MELCLYNAVLTAMSHDGKAFTYVNQLASSDTDPSKREDWFTVACCPPNMLRVLGSIGGYIWDLLHKDDAKSSVLTVNLYISCTLECEVAGQPLRITQKTDWPWDSKVDFNVESSVPELTLKLRIPAYASSHEITPACPNVQLENGYLTIPSEWLADQKRFNMSAHLESILIAPNP